MDKDQAPIRRQKPKLDQQNNFLSTREEKEQLHAFADRKGWSLSQSLRYLVNKGLATEDEGE
jgi:hypothetical protein